MWSSSDREPLMWPGLAVAAALVLGGVPLPARAAGTAEVARATCLLREPRDRAPIVHHLEVGQALRVLGREGPWIHVEAGRRHGWVDGRDARPGAARDDRVAGPALRVGAAVVVDEPTAARRRPSRRAPRRFVVRAGQRLKIAAVDSRHPDWVLVAGARGARGWVAVAALRPAATPAAPARDTAPTASAPPIEEPRSPPAAVAQAEDHHHAPPAEAQVSRPAPHAGHARLNVSLDAAVGVLTGTREFSSKGSGPRANYQIAPTAPVVMVSAAASRAFGWFMVGVEAMFMSTLGSPQLTVLAGSDLDSLGWSAWGADVMAMAGLHVKRVMVCGRVGYHGMATNFERSTVARLASEIMHGVNVGAEIGVPDLFGRLSLRLAFDAMVGGTFKQKAGFRDGDMPMMMGHYLSANASYQWTRRLVTVVSYSLAHETTDFMGPSEAQADATMGKRRDLGHMVGAGMRFLF